MPRGCPPPCGIVRAPERPVSCGKGRFGAMLFHSKCPFPAVLPCTKRAMPQVFSGVVSRTTERAAHRHGRKRAPGKRRHGVATLRAARFVVSGRPVPHTCSGAQPPRKEKLPPHGRELGKTERRNRQPAARADAPRRHQQIVAPPAAEAGRQGPCASCPGPSRGRRISS